MFQKIIAKKTAIYLCGFPNSEALLDFLLPQNKTPFNSKRVIGLPFFPGKFDLVEINNHH